ncbi:TetR/AcrR family transcriptional regulator [Fodinicola acaciae]|uniref:TetR/AcrR family transcriptional regulator n=1 Tax=Fodinicola acaciae TaxID=2681555 RepID=UPI001FE67BD8|nr:TetR/AcrR family transcriptional regulator [Fodinicola acaciae]
MAEKRRLSKQDWADAALAALADGGLAAVAVEPLAARLGATKGSFYWHFANRDALVQAALERWADRQTEQIIRDVEPITDPLERLRAVFEITLGAGRVSRAELAMLAHADDPLVAPVLARVTARRVDFLEACYVAAGAAQARQRAVLAYTAHIGLIQAQRASGGTLVTDADRPAYLRFLYRAISV